MYHSVDPQYLHTAEYAVESKNIQDQIMIALRKVKGRQHGGRRITAGLLKSSTAVAELLKTDQTYKFLQNVRGSPPYWQKVFCDVLAMVRQLGCPTWFMSRSAADMHWPELLTLIEQQRGCQLSEQDVSQLSWDEKC